MKKIKRLELRTGQVLNPLQQGFVVGGHKHSWVSVAGCSCQADKDYHIEKCTNVQYETESSTGGSGGFSFSIGWWGISIPITIGSSGTGSTRRKKITCKQKALFGGFDEKGEKIHTYKYMDDEVEYVQ